MKWGMSVNNLVLKEGFQDFDLSISDGAEFNVVVPKGVRCDALIHLKGSGEAKIEWTVEKDGYINLFYINDADQINLTENYYMMRDSEMDLAYGDFNEGSCERVTDVYFKEQGSTVRLKSASLVKNVRKLKYRFIHQATYTYGDMENFVVQLDQGTLSLHAIGKIEKTAANSETHQTSRILNFNATNRAQVYPQLYIDNNDVKASHAESSGQVDPEQLYYLKSRGLSADEAVSLIVKGYLSSILDNIKNEDIKLSLLASIEKKVDEVCST
jgi:Fe-S cluster assembly protein SufD